MNPGQEEPFPQWGNPDEEVRTSINPNRNSGGPCRPPRLLGARGGTGRGRVPALNLSLFYRHQFGEGANRDAIARPSWPRGPAWQKCHWLSGEMAQELQRKHRLDHDSLTGEELWGLLMVLALSPMVPGFLWFLEIAVGEAIAQLPEDSHSRLTSCGSMVTTQTPSRPQ